MDEPSDMGKAALALAEAGFHVFPIRKGTRARHRGGWKELASVDPDKVARMWARFPDDNIGISCGPSGLLVLDIDVKKGKDGPATLQALELEHGNLPTTLMAMTPSGGEHLYFRVPEPSSSSVERVGRGLDVRSGGGYVVAPPSTIEGEESLYEWWSGAAVDEIAEAPAWLVESAGRRKERDPERDIPAAELDTDYAVARVERYLLEDAPAALEGEGGNITTYAVACGARDLGVSENECRRLMSEHYNPRCEPPWDEDELEVVVSHAYSYAIDRAGSASPDADFQDEDEDEDDEEPRRRSGIMDEWVWVAAPQWFVRRSDGARLSRVAMDSLHDHLVEKGHFSDRVFGSKAAMRKLTRLQFRPGAEEFLGEEYNLWKDTGCGSSPGDASWLQEHMEYMCGDEADHALDYLAHMVQHRGSKMSYALMIQGGQGIGKSLIGTLMRRILGPTNVEFPTNDELHGQFTEWALGRELVVIQELMASGRHQMANKLKPLITEDYVRVEEKHRSPYTVENHMNFLVFTNHEDPIPLERDDRRFLVIMSLATPRDEAYYDRLFDAILFGDGAAHAAHMLMERDLSKFNPKRRAPWTKAKEAMRRAGMHEVEIHLLERIEAEEPPFDCALTSVQDVVDCLPERLRRTSRLTNIVGRFLRQEAGALSLGQHRVNGGSTRRVLWSIRDHDDVAAMPAVARSRAYDESRFGEEMAPDIKPVGDDFMEES